MKTIRLIALGLTVLAALLVSQGQHSAFAQTSDLSVGPITKWQGSVEVTTTGISTGLSTPNYVDVKSSITNGDDGPVTVMAAFTQTSFPVVEDPPCTGIGDPRPGCDADADGWVNFVEAKLMSNRGNPASTPEAGLTPDNDGNGIADSCEDGIDNDLQLGVDMADPKCADSDGDKWPDGFEASFGSLPTNLDSTIEHAWMPWTCFDGIDNDLDGTYDNDTVSSTPELDSSPPFGDPDTYPDCSQAQLDDVNGDGEPDPITYNCVSGWMPVGRASQGEYTPIIMQPNGDLTTLDIFPVGPLAADETVAIQRPEIIMCDVLSPCLGNWTELNGASIMSVLPPAVDPNLANNQQFVPLTVEVLAVDSDSDGIADEVDSLLGTYSDDFSDQTLGGTTYGSILNRNGLTVQVCEEPNPDGVCIKVTGSGGGLATVSVCGNVSFGLASGSTMVVTCQCATVEVLAGPVEATFGLFRATLPTDTTTTIDELAPGAFQVTNSPASTSPITVNGIQIPPGVTESDNDGDVFFTSIELFMGTDPLDDCPDDVNDPAWPPDFNNSTKVTSGDLVLFRQHYVPLDPGIPYDARYDLNASGAITSGDLVVFGKYWVGSGYDTCTP